MAAAPRQLVIMIAGPYTSGGATAAQRAANLRFLNEVALAVWERGHVPLIGVNAVKPIIEVAGAHRYDELMMSIWLALADRCDAVLRVGGSSKGADDEVARIAAGGGRVFRGVDEIPKV
ncbi:MAG: hypothetical protein SFV19_15035 [Rhodospirillaceae bacterium]|nr:hypothetical protein [Rhodospirillaceae bacterium]